jgi:ankyrin repeat protein
VAAFEGHNEVIEQLLAKGADVNAKDNDGNSPLSLATARSNTAVVELLKARGAK